MTFYARIALWLWLCVCGCVCVYRGRVQQLQSFCIRVASEGGLLVSVLGLGRVAGDKTDGIGRAEQGGGIVFLFCISQCVHLLGSS